MIESQFGTHDTYLDRLSSASKKNMCFTFAVLFRLFAILLVSKNTVRLKETLWAHLIWVIVVAF